MAQKRKKNKKWIFWVVIAVLFVVAAAVCYLVWDNYFRDKGENQTVEEQSIVEEKIEDKEAEQNKEVVDDREKEKDSITAYEGENPNRKEELTGVVTYAGVNGSDLIIRVNIDQYLASGSCELNLVQDDVVHSDAADIVSAAATATCEGFNVPTGGLESGNYQIVIKISSGGKAGTIIGEVKI